MSFNCFFYSNKSPTTPFNKLYFLCFRVNNQNVHSLVSKEKTSMIQHSKNSSKNLTLPLINKTTIQIINENTNLESFNENTTLQNKSEYTTVQDISEKITLKNDIERTTSCNSKNIELSAIKCVRNSTLEIESTPNVKLKSLPDILLSSTHDAGQSSRKILIEKNGCLRAPVASPELVSETDSSHSRFIFVNLLSFQTESPFNLNNFKNRCNL